MKRWIAILMAALMAVSVAGCSQQESGEAEGEAEKEPIVVGTSGNHKLFTQYNDDGELEGFEIDVWNEIGKRLGRDVEFEVMDFSGLLGALDSKKIDTVANQMGMTSERQEKYNFSDVYVYSPYKLFVAASENSVNSIEDLFGKSFAITSGSSTLSYIQEMDPEGKIDIVVYQGGGNNYILDIASGKVTASVEAVIPFEDIKESSGCDIKQVGDPIFYEQNAYPFRKDDEGEALRDEVNQALAEMREDGFLQETSMKWLKLDATEKPEGME